MMSPKPQPDFNEHLIMELVKALPAAMPLLEKLVAAGHRLRAENTAAITPLPCDSCPKLKKGECREPCKALNSLLPKCYGGKIHNEGTIDLDFDNFRSAGTYSDDGSEEGCQDKSDRSKLQNIRKICRLEVLEEYKKCWPIYTDKERVVLVLRYGEGKTIRQIAKELGKAASTVWGLLKKAEKRKQEYDNIELEKILRLKKKMCVE